MIRTDHIAPPMPLIAAPPPLPALTPRLFPAALVSAGNSPNNVRIRVKEIELYTLASKNENLNKMPGIAVQRQPYERLISYGLCLSAVDSVGQGGNLKEMANTLCDKFPREPATDSCNDNALHHRGMGFISHLKFAGAMKDSTVIALPLQIGFDVKKGVVDPTLIEHAEKAWDRHITLSTKA